MRGEDAGRLVRHQYPVEQTPSDHARDDMRHKGDQLDNLDTAYQREVLSCPSSFAWDDCTPAGELELVADNGQTGQCARSS